MYYDLWIQRYPRCALVGNSQRLLLHKFGEEINGYDAVMRLNQAPTGAFADWVGSKTTYRMINNFWANTYSSSKVGPRTQTLAPPTAQGLGLLSLRTARAGHLQP